MPNENQIIAWEAPEFRYYEKTSGWYIALVAVAILLIAFFIFQGDWFGAVTILILAAFVWFFSRQEPQVVLIQLTPTVLKFGNIQYPYKQLRYFWIVNNANHRTLNFQTTTVINNTIVIELLDQDEELIRQFLLPHVPEHEKTDETWAQRIAHKMRF